jgi:hypothetical protein
MVDLRGAIPADRATVDSASAREQALRLFLSTLLTPS